MIVAAAVALAGLGGFSPRAEAGLEISIGFGQTYVSGHASCGCPIYTRRVCRGFDRYHRPVFDHHRQPFRCGCKHKNHPPGYAYGHDKHYKSKHYKSKHSKSKHSKSKHYKSRYDKHHKPKYDKHYKSYKKSGKKCK